MSMYIVHRYVAVVIFGLILLSACGTTNRQSASVLPTAISPDATAVPTATAAPTTAPTATAAPAATTAPTDAPAPTATAAPTATEAPTDAPAPTAMPTAEATLTEPTAEPASALILDMPNLVGKSMPEVEQLLGEGKYPAPFQSGDRLQYAGAGEARTYMSGEYMVVVNYDTAGVVKGLWIEDGLKKEGYELQDWPELFTRVGLPTNQQPDKTAPAAAYWNNVNGYYVSVAKTLREPIWQIQVWEAQK